MEHTQQSWRGAPTMHSTDLFSKLIPDKLPRRDTIAAMRRRAAADQPCGRRPTVVIWGRETLLIAHLSVDGALKAAVRRCAGTAMRGTPPACGARWTLAGADRLLCMMFMLSPTLLHAKAIHHQSIRPNLIEGLSQSPVLAHGWRTRSRPREVCL